MQSRVYGLKLRALDVGIFAAGEFPLYSAVLVRLLLLHEQILFHKASRTLSLFISLPLSLSSLQYFLNHCSIFIE